MRLLRAFAIGACLCGSSDAWAANVKTYPATMCNWTLTSVPDLSDGCVKDGLFGYQDHTAYANATSNIECPIVRECAVTTTPYVTVEGYNHSNAGTAFSCTVAWSQEDLAANLANTIDVIRRGYFVSKSLTSTGYGRITFAVPADGMSGVGQSEQQEGAMSLTCTLAADDRLLRYSVDEACAN